MERTLEPSEEINGKTAHEYVEFSQWRSGTYAVIAYDILEKIGKNFKGKILEVGCTGGLLVSNLHKLLPKVQITAIDSADEMIKITKKNYGHLDNVKFLAANVYSLPFNSASFGLIICQGTLHHFYNVEKALKEMLRVSKKDSLIYIQDLRRDVPNKKIDEKLDSMKGEYQKERELTSIKASLTRQEIKQLMKKLNISSYKLKPAVFSQKNLEKNKKAIKKSKFNEIKSMKDLEYILWIKK